MGARGSGTGVKLMSKAADLNWVPERCRKALLAFHKNVLVLLVRNERRKFFNESLHVLERESFQYCKRRKYLKWANRASGFCC